MPKNWKTYKLDELGQILNHKRIPLNSIERESRKGQYPYYGASGIVDYIDDFIFEDEHVLISEDGENLRSRQTPIAFKANGKFWVNNHAHIFKGREKWINDFIVYFFRNSDLGPYITGAVQPKLNKENLLRVPIKFQSEESAKQIASILSSLDNKIELNLQMNQTLEAIAQAIFKQWFVNFNFPGSDGKLVDGLPKGWTKKSIGEIASNVQYGFTQSSSTELIGPKFLRITDIQGGLVNWGDVPYCEISDSDLSKYKIKEHDIFIARTGASTGENIYVVNPPEAVFASYLIRVQFDKPSLACFVGKFIRREEYFNFISSVKGGSAQPNANAKQLTSVEINIPTMDLLDEFHEIVNPLNRKIVLNYQENECLSQLRDSLLPNLMSGKLEVQA